MNFIVKKLVSLEFDIVGLRAYLGKSLLWVRESTHTSCVGTFRTLMPGEVRPKLRSILLSLPSFRTSKAGRRSSWNKKYFTVCISYRTHRELESWRKGHPSKPKKVRVIASPGAPSTSSLGRVLGLEHWKAAKVQPILPKDILVDTSNHQSVVNG